MIVRVECFKCKCEKKEWILNKLPKKDGNKCKKSHKRKTKHKTHEFLLKTLNQRNLELDFGKCIKCRQSFLVVTSEKEKQESNEFVN